MIACLNGLKYDIGVTGNYEYDYGIDALRKTASSFEGAVLCGNVWDEHGEAVASGYTIMDKDGVLEPQCDHNWEIVGNDWDPVLHQQAMDALVTGKLSIADATKEGRILSSEVITEAQLKGATG